MSFSAEYTFCFPKGDAKVADFASAFFEGLSNPCRRGSLPQRKLFFTRRRIPKHNESENKYLRCRYDIVLQYLMRIKLYYAQQHIPQNTTALDLLCNFAVVQNEAIRSHEVTSTGPE